MSVKRLLIIAAAIVVAYFVVSYVQAYRETKQSLADSTATETAAQEDGADHSYSVISGNLTWDEAYAQAEAQGGHLATLTTQEEFDEANRLCAASGLTYGWLGAYRGADGYVRVTGEPFALGADWWAPGEPSGRDRDGTAENYLCWWQYYGGSLNDIAGVLPVVGQTGYLVEWD